MLAEYKKKLESTIKPAISIKLSSQPAQYPWSSKVGGAPYLPVDMDYPVDIEGKKLQFLAQINFEEMPHLEGYPNQGILVFYIGTDDLYGANFDDPTNQNQFKVIYFEDITHDVKIILPEYAEESPIQCESSMVFKSVQRIISGQDFNFERLLGKEVYEYFLENEELFEKDYGAQGHLVGGYPYFTQDDPRGWNEKIQDYILLFQLDTDDDFDICWGDAGVGNFFIHPNDLKNRDFSRVAYTWDCC